VAGLIDRTAALPDSKCPYRINSIIVSPLMKKIDAAVILSLAVMPGCTFLDQVEIFNNTTTGVEIRACGRTERVGDGLRITLNTLCRPPVEVISSLGRWTYAGVTDRDTIQRVGARTSVGYVVLKLQLQRDGSVIVVPPETAFPAKEVPAQPTGFPLLPT
jgi:hypothetical protein